MSTEIRDRPIAEIPKSRGKVLRIALSEINGWPLVSLRVFFYDQEGGEFRPSREGFALSLSRLPMLIEALDQAKSEAVRSGLLSAESEAA